MSYILKPGNQFPEWELYEVPEEFICMIYAANIEDAEDSSKSIIKWRTQKSLEFDVC